MASSIFDILNHVTYTKTKWEDLTEEEQNTVNPYMLHRFVSMKHDYIDIVNIIQKYQNLPAKSVYEFYCNVLPKQKVYFKYVKASNKQDSETIKGLAEYFECSEREAREYLTILDTQQVSVILNEIKGHDSKGTNRTTRKGRPRSKSVC